MKPSHKWLIATVGILGLWALAKRRKRQPLRGDVALITGGSRGLGLEMARQLGHRGFRVALIARDRDELQRAATQLRKSGITALPLVADVCSRDAVDAAVRSTVEAYGRLDVVVNNAGLIQVGPLDNLTESDFRAAVELHMMAPLFVTLAARPHLRGGGHIINIASVGGRAPIPHLLPYVASKFGLVGLSQGLAIELASEEIAVTTVCPGLMRTGSHLQARFKGSADAEFTWFSTMDALPGLSVSIQVAAARIIDAAAARRAFLTITPQAAVLGIAAATVPNLFLGLMKRVNRLMPPAIPDGNESVPGYDCTLIGLPRWALFLADRAAEQQNEQPI